MQEHFSSSTEHARIDSAPITPETEAITSRKSKSGREIREAHVLEFHENVNQQMRERNVETTCAALEGEIGALVEDVQSLERADLREDHPLFKARMEAMRSCFQPNAFAPFERWVKHAVSGSGKDWMSRNARLWILGAALGERARSAANTLEKSGFAEFLKKMEAPFELRNRIADLRAQLEDAASMEPVSDEEVIREYVVAQSWERSDAHKARPATFWEKISGGKKEMKPEDAVEEVWGEFRPEYMLVRTEKGMARGDRLRGTIGGSRFRPAGRENKGKGNADKTREAAASIQELWLGRDPQRESVGDLPLEGWSEYRDHAGLPVEARAVLESLSGIIGRKSFVKRIMFSREQHPGFSHFAGFYVPEEKAIVYQAMKGREIPDMLRTMIHEAAHAMDLERTLPLPDALRFFLEMKEAMASERPVTNYSANAEAIMEEVYVGQMANMRSSGGSMFGAHAVDMLIAKQEYLRKHADKLVGRSVLEEWAEMLSIAALVKREEFDDRVPKKNLIIEKYLARYGMEMEEIRDAVRQTMQGAVMDHAAAERERERTHGAVVINVSAA